MRGYVFSRSKGSWSIVIYLGCDANGKQRQKWHTFHGNKEQAEAYCRTLLDHSPSQPTLVSSLPLEAFAARWLKDYVLLNLRPTTQVQYQSMLAHAIRHLGTVCLDRLSAARLQTFYADLLRDGGPNGPLSHRTVRHVHTVLHRMLTHAVRWGLIVKNPADLVEPPRVTKGIKTIWTPEQVARFLAITREHDLYPAFWLAIMTGLRRGELLALQWDDVDWARGMLLVRRSVSPAAKGRLFVGETKTPAGMRTVTLSPQTLSILREHRNCATSDLVFPGSNGYMNPRAFTRRFEVCAMSAGLPHMAFHGCRHVCASLLAAVGTHPKVAAEQLGHADVAMTMYYSHASEALLREAAAATDRLISKALASPANCQLALPPCKDETPS